MESITHCAACVYAREDKAMSEGKWKAIECGNPSSEYHRALLNVSADGDKRERIVWRGCAHGERREGV
jgi:hypothetical protein